LKAYLAVRSVSQIRRSTALRSQEVATGVGRRRREGRGENEA